MTVPDNLPKRSLTDIQYFIVHHSVGPQTMDITEVAEEEIASQGFLTIGYNAYVKKNGHFWVVQEGRPIDTIPAAAYGLNTASYDICIAGNYHPNVPNIPTDEVEQESIDLVLARIKAVKAKCPNLKFLIGHRDVATIMERRGLNPGDYSTDCPGDRLYAFLHHLRTLTGLTVPPGLAA